MRGWLNRDPIQEMGGINLYQFLRNNPVDFLDSLGLDLYIIPGIHPIIIGDAPVGCYTIAYGIPEGVLYLPWNPGSYSYEPYPLNTPEHIANAHQRALCECKRLRTCSPVDAQLAELAKSLGSANPVPDYSFFSNNCRHFADRFMTSAGNLMIFGTPYYPSHSRRNGVVIR
jgi:hypothetical protein